MGKIANARQWMAGAACVLGVMLSACNGSSADGQASASATSSTSAGSGGSATTAAADTPSITGSPSTSVTVGTAYSFQPKASAPTDGTLTFTIANKPAWASFNASTGLLSGTPTASDVGTDANVEIGVSDGTGAAQLPAFTITVKAASAAPAVTLSWTAPTQYTSGTTMTNLAGYHIYYGTQSGNYTSSIQVANPGLTSYALDNLAPGTYYIAMTAYDSQGTESAYSAELQATVN